MRIAILGAGNVGTALGRKISELGHKVVFGVRNPQDEKYEPLKGAGASLKSVAEAAKEGELIILATPWLSTENAILNAGNNLNGKILIDCTNPLKEDLSGLTIGFDFSGGEQVQQWAPSARVYKAFNTVGSNIMADPVIDGRKAVMFFCGDDDRDRGTLKDLIEAIGFEAIDAGDLKTSRLLEPYALLWIQSAFMHGLGREFAFMLMRR